LARERDTLAAERARLVGERDAAASELASLRTQQAELRTANATLGRDLASARDSLDRLQDEFSSTRDELSASRSADLAYPKNDLVYAGVVPGVRNLDAFLQSAAVAAAGRGARGTPPARLNAAARERLEISLRGLNASAFVQCRAANNTAVGFPVDLTCAARPNSVLYRGGQTIRRATVTLGDSRTVQNQIQDLVQDTVIHLTTRGVPAEYITDGGLGVNEFVDLLTRLSSRSGSSAAVAIAAREDVRPGGRVDLYPVLP
ncbi:DUF3084 domain-containing protein, partial [Deinococcus sp. MIMF12]|nr:DUF3084 domain-containing protein [Deinococcus rhizophilus]